VPVREAVQRLIAEGLLTGDPFRRVEVTTVSTAEVAELLDIREQLEVMALRRWLESGQERSMQRAHDANDRFASEHDDSVRNQYDYQFHQELMAAMPVAAQMVRDIRSRTQKYIERVHIRSTPRPSGWEEHEAILHAIEQGQDSLAIELLQRHIDATRQLLLRAPERTP
jgi:DNA-binding GntR family transcriptional regulator